MRKQNLRGMGAVITGGSTAVAAELARALARRGVQVCLVGPQADALELAERQVRSDGGACRTAVSELHTLEQAQAVIEAARNLAGWTSWPWSRPSGPADRSTPTRSVPGTWCWTATCASRS